MRFATCPATIAPSAKLTSQNARSELPMNINPPAWSGWPGISRRSRRVISHRKRAQRKVRHSQPKNRRMNSGTLTNAFHHPAKDKVRYSLFNQYQDGTSSGGTLIIKNVTSP